MANREMSLSDVAAELGYRTTGHLRRACQKGQIRGARKVGKTWLVTLPAAKAWADGRKPWGRERGEPIQKEVQE